ncbi:MAG: hypothetical protein WA303_22075 [Bradyrhizobium sp.]
MGEEDMRPGETLTIAGFALDARKWAQLVRHTTALPRCSHRFLTSGAAEGVQVRAGRTVEASSKSRDNPPVFN